MKSWRLLRVLHIEYVWLFQVHRKTYKKASSKANNLAMTVVMKREECRQFSHFLNLCKGVVSTWRKKIFLSLFHSFVHCHCYIIMQVTIITTTTAAAPKKITMIFHVSRFINQFSPSIFSCYFVLLLLLMCWISIGIFFY